jgi:hypothetical protein
LADLQGRFPIKKISGHNQYSTKACPGFSVPSWLHDKTVPPMRPPVSDDVRTSRRQSSTMKATAVTSIAGAGGVITALSSLDPTSQYIVLGFSALAMVGLGWIARERLRKWAAGDRWLILGRIKIWLAMAGAFAFALGAAYLRGRSGAVAAAERERLKSYVDTRKRIDEVSVGDDPHVLRDWLRDRSKQ